MATKRASAKMPALKHAIILQAEVETLKVQVEALRGALSELASNTECLLRDANPMTPSAKIVERLCRRAQGILNTYAGDRVRAYFEGLERDRVYLDFVERSTDGLLREGENWAVDLRAGTIVRTKGSLREVLKEAFEEADLW